MKRTLLVYSGGMDSTVLLYHLREQGHKVSAVSFDYGQRHSRELQCAASICSRLGIEHTTLKLPGFTGSALTGDCDVPHGHYADETMKKTVVPNRNMVMLAHATSLAIAVGMDHVAYAAHSGDHAIYPDCRPEFVGTMSAAIYLCDWSNVTLLAPFIAIDKGEIARIGHRLGVPFDETWTCYEGQDEPCGECGACVERQEALNII